MGLPLVYVVEARGPSISRIAVYVLSYIIRGCLPERQESGLQVASHPGVILAVKGYVNNTMFEILIFFHCIALHGVCDVVRAIL